MSVKRCARCGSEFECSEERDCWCESYQIHRAQLVKVMEYTDCLCPECLALFIEK